MKEDELTDIKYVLEFALQVIEDNELQQVKNNDNWRIGKSLEDQIEIIDICLTL